MRNGGSSTVLPPKNCSTCGCRSSRQICGISRSRPAQTCLELVVERGRRLLEDLDRDKRAVPAALVDLGEAALAYLWTQLNLEGRDEPVGAHGLDAVRDREHVDAATEEATLDVGGLLGALVHRRYDRQRRLGRPSARERRLHHLGVQRRAPQLLLEGDRIPLTRLLVARHNFRDIRRRVDVERIGLGHDPLELGDERGRRSLARPEQGEKVLLSMVGDHALLFISTVDRARDAPGSRR